jgi:hypothetical protein
MFTAAEDVREGFILAAVSATVVLAIIYTYMIIHLYIIFQRVLAIMLIFDLKIRWASRVPISVFSNFQSYLIYVCSI